jgi:hypothetical protein
VIAKSYLERQVEYVFNQTHVMAKHILYYIKQQGYKCLAVCFALTAFLNTYAHEGKGLTTEAKVMVPVTGYQWFMIGVAITYTICLVIRARRRKIRRKTEDQI